jgi:nucleotide-binding universal stress UspA family protein
MYKNILIATGGSSLSARAVEHGSNLAKSLGAKVLLLTVTERFHVFALEAEQVEETSASFREHMQKQVECTLSEASEIVRKLGVEATTLHMEDDAPYRAIIRMAEDHCCNLIVMASHGRGGISALLLGAEMTKVLSGLKITVLFVCWVSRGPNPGSTPDRRSDR